MQISQQLHPFILEVYVAKLRLLGIDTAQGGDEYSKILVWISQQLHPFILEVYVVKLRLLGIDTA